ncbi:hypothetical protein BH23ACT3_BH23ACT3_02970 [soil metagenome]
MNQPLSRLHSRAVALLERFRTSLFVVPMLFVIAAVVIAQVTLALDRFDRIGTFNLPFEGSTVDGARAVLTTVGAATIGFAGVAFSVSLLVVQMASSQYSPRVVSGLLSNSFSKRVMGTVVGTFTYCLMVLRAVRSESGDDGEDIVASFSVSLGVLLGVVSILAIIAFINNSAHSMDVSELFQRLTDDSVAVVRNEWREPDEYPIEIDEISEVPDHASVVHFTTSGWIQRIDHDRLLELLPEGTTFHLDVTTGRYAVMGTALGSLVPAPDETEPGSGDTVADAVRGTVHVGAARTSRQDVGYGIRQLSDVALRALSTGVNDPTTAQDALFHICVILRQLLERRPPPVVTVGDRGRRVVRHHVYDHRELVDFSFEQIRRAAADDPSVCVYLLESIHLLGQSLDHATDDARQALIDQARLVVRNCENGRNIDADVGLVREAFRRRFEA